MEIKHRLKSRWSEIGVADSPFGGINRVSWCLEKFIVDQSIELAFGHIRGRKGENQRSVKISEWSVPNEIAAPPNIVVVLASG